jgi:PAS domain S-box-containing protein
MRGRVLVVGTGRSDAVETTVSELDAVEEATAVPSEGTLSSSPDPGSFDCVVVGPSADAGLETLVLAAGGTPVVALASSPDGIERALDDGVAAVVDWTADPAVRERLLERRVRQSLRPDDSTDVRRVVSALVDDELVCTFDADGRHVVAAGERSGDLLDPDRLSGRPVTEAFADRPRLAAHLDVNYAAALENEAREREFGIGDRTYEVETTPIDSRTADGSGGGLVRFRPVDRSEAPPARGSGSKVDELRDLASELETADTESRIFDVAVHSADRILSFDACAITELEDDTLVPRAATAPTLNVSPRQLDVDEGIAGETLRSGEPRLVEDVTDDDVVDPVDEEIAAALSVPVGEEGVFQVVSTDPDTYDERDLRLAELLATHVGNALERVRYRKAITRERDSFAALYQNVPDAAVRYRLEDGRPEIESINSAFVRLFGYEPDEAVGQTTAELLVPEGEADDTADLYESIADGERIDREVRRLTADGPRPFLLRSVPISGSEKGFLIYTDLGELKRRERELARKNERLDRFASVVSHDLRNPLTVARGYVEAVDESGDLSLLSKVEESHDRMATIIDDVLTMARHGDEVSETTELEFSSRAEEAWGSVDTDAATLAVEGDPTVEADPTRLRQLLENVFRNAVEHGGDSVTVTVGEFSEGFYVEDDGPGFPDEDEGRLFDEGYTTSEDGTGLGLSIVREIASAHGWTVSTTEGRAGGARIQFHVDPSDDAERVGE